MVNLRQHHKINGTNYVSRNKTFSTHNRYVLDERLSNVEREQSVDGDCERGGDLLYSTRYGWISLDRFGFSQRETKALENKLNHDSIVYFNLRCKITQR